MSLGKFLARKLDRSNTVRTRKSKIFFLAHGSKLKGVRASGVGSLRSDSKDAIQGQGSSRQTPKKFYKLRPAV